MMVCVKMVNELYPHPPTTPRKGFYTYIDCDRPFHIHNPI